LIPELPLAGVPTATATSVTVLVEYVERLALVDPDVTPLSARATNLSTIAGALEAAGIEYFAVRSLEDRASSLAVRETDRTHVLEILRRSLSRPVGYVRCILPSGSGRNPILPGSEEGTWARLKKASVLRCYWNQTDPDGHLVYGLEYGCDIEFWNERNGVLLAPRANRCTRAISNLDWLDVDANALTRIGAMAPPCGHVVRTLRDFAVTLPEDITFPIDAVYTWVDGTDPAWAAKKASSLGQSYHAEASSAARYLSRNELRYSLRSLHAFAPWLRKIFIVTDDQRPPWLVDADPRIELVSHREIFADSDWLPTYNSHAIETQLHHIPGIAEHFLYFNDDMFLGRPVAPNAFFLSNGIAKFFPSQSRVPQGPVTDSDTPVDAACKNNRRLLGEQFASVITQSMQHVPYALKRSGLEEMERTFPDAFEVTAASKVRSQTDHSFTSSFHQYYSYLTGRGISGSVRYTYIQLAVPDLAARLDRLLARRDQDAICLNDAYSTPEQLEAQTELVTPFFDAYFPVPSPFEEVTA
jgi:hypothetical protein